MNLVLLTAIHGRHGVVARWIEHYGQIVRRLKGLSLGIFAAISPSDAAMCPKLDGIGAKWVVVRNEPVSLKWQAALEQARALWPQLGAVMVMGSDDFANDAFILRAAEVAASGESPAFGCDGVGMFDAATGRLGLWRTSDMTPGAGRVFTAPLLDRLGWRLWTKEKNAGLDTHCRNRLRKLGYEIDTLRLRADECVVDVKTGDNIHAFGDFRFESLLGPKDAATYLARQGLSVCLDCRKEAGRG